MTIARNFAAACMTVAMLLMLAPIRANAQVQPPVPVPDPSGAVGVIVGTIEPPAAQVADALTPVASAGGVGLRPACASYGSVHTLLAISGPVLPNSGAIGTTLQPLSQFCSHTHAYGPADQVFGQIDGAVGPTLDHQVGPLWTQAGDGVTPVRDQVGQVCLIGLFIGAIPGSLPPPVKRYDAFGLICG